MPSEKITVEVSKAEKEKSLTIDALSSVPKGTSFTVSGKYTENGSGLGGETVDLYVNGAWQGDTTTLSDGSYSFSVTIGDAGTYTIYTEADGIQSNKTDIEISSYAPLF